MTKFYKFLGRITLIAFVCVLVFPISGYSQESAPSFSKARSQQNTIEIKAHLKLARDFQARGKLRKAEEEFRKVLKLQPNHFQAHLQLGVVYKNQKRYQDAVVEFKKALSFQSNSIAHKNLGITYLKLGDHLKAVKEFEAVIKINPNTENIHFLLAKALFQNKTGNFQRAIDEFKEALKANPRLWEANFGLGLVYKSQKLYKDAIPQFEAVAALNPEYADAFYQLGYMYMGAKEGKAAITNFLKAEEIYKRNENKQKLGKTRKYLKKLFEKYGLDRSDF